MKPFLKFRRALSVALFLSLAPIASARPAAPATADYLVAPLRIGKQNQLFISVLVNGRRATLAVDTGSPLTCIDEAKARRFDLRPVAGGGDLPASVVANGRSHRVTRIASLRLGELQLVNVPAVLIDLNDINRALRRSHDLEADGIFGLDLLLTMHAVIDYGHSRIFLKTHDSEASLTSPISRRGWSPVPMRLGNGHLVVNSRVNASPATLLVDTGSPVSALDRAFCDQHHIESQRGAFFSQGIHFSDASAGVAWVRDFRIGSYNAHGTPIAVFDIARLLASSHTQLHTDGLLGSYTLRKNAGVIDCEAMLLYLKPTR